MEETDEDKHEQDEENIYLDVTGEPKKKYRDLVEAIKDMDGGCFIQSILKFNFYKVIIHDNKKMFAYNRYREIIKIYDIHRERCTNEYRPKRNDKKRFTCICDEQLKYLYLWDHKNFKEKIIIGSTCFINLCDFIYNVYSNLPELIQHITVLKTQFQIAERRRHYMKCEKCGEFNIHHELDAGEEICTKCKAKETRLLAEVEERLLRKQRQEAEIALKRSENRRCYKCKDYNIPKDNIVDICCNICVTVEGRHKYIDCLGCDGKVLVIAKKFMYNGREIDNGCELYCDRWGCREGTRGRSNLDFFQDEDFDLSA